MDDRMKAQLEQARYIERHGVDVIWNGCGWRVHRVGCQGLDKDADEMFADPGKTGFSILCYATFEEAVSEEADLRGMNPQEVRDGLMAGVKPCARARVKS